MEDLIEWLQNVYAIDLCNGSWEHTHGFTITNIDNPGWDFRFELGDTDLEGIPLSEVLQKNTDRDWYHCRIINGVFIGSGGAQNLRDILSTFQEWYLNASRIADQRKGIKNNGL